MDQAAHAEITASARRRPRPRDPGGLLTDSSRHVDWDRVESWRGLRLPADYRAVAGASSTAGPGSRHGRHRRTSRRQSNDPGGPLGWGHTRRCDLLPWDTAAANDPDHRPVVVFHSDAVTRREDRTTWARRSGRR
ncbi:hypothetical protein CS0771_41290 [Catellatospora sp. IY07-71]|nr:hypothetical protein CS0771_41290 [Catellatospora sp. IY07-71]